MPKKGRQAIRMTPGFSGPFKGAPQQGTLFDKRALDYQPANVNLTRQRPGPRGYSPARLAEVRGAFDTAYTTGPNSAPVSRPVEVGGAPNSRLNEAAHQFGPSTYDPQNPQWGRARSRILDTLSRSTIDVKDEMANPLAGLGRIETRLAGSDTGQFAGMYKHHGGYDQPDELGNRRYQGPTVTLFSHGGSNQAMHGRDEEAEQTLMHEIGHHDSAIAGTEHSSYDTPRKQAQEEAYADKFALTHFRRDPRNPGAYDPREHTYMSRGLSGHFGQDSDSYRRNFPASMHPPARRNLGPQFEQPELDEDEEGSRGGEVFWGQGIERR